MGKIAGERKTGSRRDSDRFTFNLPFASGKFSGEKVIFLLVLLLAIAPIVYGLYLHHTTNDDRLKSIEDGIIAMTYVLTLSPTEREKLNLSKPRKIREMERSQRKNID